MAFETRTVRVAKLGLEFEILADDAIIGPAIAAGSWAADETALLAAYIARSMAPDRTPRVLDLGANVGWFSVCAILAGADVIAFEPVPAIADVCQRNIERAQAARKASGGPAAHGELHRVAAGAERGSAQIALGGTNHGDNRVVEGRRAPEDMGSAALCEIRIAPVDELVQGSIDFLKVDTQGSEWLALAGAEELLARSPDLGLLIELWPYALRGATAEQLVAKLAGELGFRLGKATDAPYPMSPERILAQVGRRDPVRGGIDLYGVRGRLPFHVLGPKARLKGLVRSVKED